MTGRRQIKVSARVVVLAGLAVAVAVGLAIWGLTGRGPAHQTAGPSPAPRPSASPASPAPSSSNPAQGAAVAPIEIRCPAPTTTVTSARQLQAALTAAHAGDVIQLADGTYPGHFSASARATAAAPIYLCGSRRAVLDGGSITSGYTFHLDAAVDWRLSGFSVRGGQKGVVADHTTGTVMNDLDVGNVGDEGIHLRAFSTGDSVQRNTVHDTGLHSAKFGEGIYVGSAQSNWCTYSGCNADRSDHDLVYGNTVTRTTAENVDIKEGTSGGILASNHFDGAGMTSADSWVDVKGNGWTVTGNVGTSSQSSSITDGYQTHQILAGWGTGNAFSANTGNLATSGYAFHLTPVLANEVACDNAVTGPTSGLANVSCVRQAVPDSVPDGATPADTTATKHHKHKHSS